MMADISKCKGDNCDVKEHCYRYKAISGFRQAYLVHDQKGKECSYFWDIREKGKEWYKGLI